MSSYESQSKISELQAEIEKLKAQASAELKTRRLTLLAEIQTIDDEIALLGGSGIAPVRRRRRSVGEPRMVTYAELKSLLDDAPDKTLNLRKEGIEVSTVKALVKNHPELELSGKGPWPTVTLV